MNDRGPIKVKEITFAQTERVEAHAKQIEEFMEDIFGLMPGEYFITDESDIRDFTELGSSDTSGIWERINRVFGVGPEVGSGRVVDILDAIARTKNVQ
jgi:hypothetical protein